METNNDQSSLGSPAEATPRTERGHVIFDNVHMMQRDIGHLLYLARLIDAELDDDRSEVKLGMKAFTTACHIMTGRCERLERFALLDEEPVGGTGDAVAT